MVSVNVRRRGQEHASIMNMAVLDQLEKCLLGTLPYLTLSSQRLEPSYQIRLPCLCPK